MKSLVHGTIIAGNARCDKRCILAIVVEEMAGGHQNADVDTLEEEQ
jgi:hypothetical protein